MIASGLYFVLYESMMDSWAKEGGLTVMPVLMAGGWAGELIF